MIKKILMVLCLVFVLWDAAMANDEYFRVDYYEDPDIYVYSPAVIEENALYPVLYLIHGRWQDASIWEEIGLSEVLDSLYAAMIYHTVYNASCLVLPYLASGQGEADVAIDAATVFSLALQTIMIAAMMRANTVLNPSESE